MSILRVTTTYTAPRAQSSVWEQTRKYVPHYLSIAPFYLLFSVFGVFPACFSLYLAFHKWDGIEGMQFVGFKQFQFLLTDTLFWQAVLNTLEIWLVATIPMLCLSLVIAFLLNAPLRWKRLYQIAYFLPNVTSVVAVTLMFGSLYANQAGLINALLHMVGLPRVEWLNTPLGIKIAIATMLIWRWTGHNAIIYLAGLQAIPGALYEAARIDGANSWHILTRITVPLLRPVILFTLLTSTIAGFQIFTEPQVLVGNDGGPGNAGLTVALYLYQQAFTHGRFGYGATIGWALFIIVLALSVINWQITRRVGAGASMR